MQYPSNHFIGDLGQHILGYKIAKKTGWVFRRTSERDIGIDGEVQVIENGVATSNIFKVQIKSHATLKSYKVKDASSKSLVVGQKKASVYIDERHISYWRAYSIPVVVFLVINDTRKVFWELISPYKEYKTKRKAYVIDFDRNDYKLDKFDKKLSKRFERVITPWEIRNDYLELLELYEQNKEDLEQYNPSHQASNQHHDDFQLRDLLLETKRMMKIISKLEIHAGWAYQDIEEELDHIKFLISEIEDECEKRDIDESGMLQK